jgi:flagellar hook-length control protein FliK
MFGTLPGGTPTAQLAGQLQGPLSGNIVQAALVVLRDGNMGTINLQLKPESLGSVKIKLEMSDSKITGKILVQSDDALKAFRQELHSLEQAFRDGGFNASVINLSVSADAGQGAGGQFAQGNQQTQQSGQALNAAWWTRRSDAYAADESYGAAGYYYPSGPGTHGVALYA